MIIPNFRAFQGQHCETTATGSLLYQLGIELSEPMLFGLGEGLGFIFWNMKSMDFPFIGGRIKPDAITENICKNLNLHLEVKETASTKKAWQNVVQELKNEKAVGLKLDCYHLDYFSSKIHFAGHYVALYGFDETHAYLVDTQQQGGKVKTNLESLALARNEKGPMSSKNKSYIIKNNNQLGGLNQALKTAISNNAETYLNPPIKNLNYKGIKKTASEIKKWLKKSNDVKREFQTTALLMERAGTGGALFRNLYRDFLKESFEHLRLLPIKKAYEDFVQIAPMWTQVANQLHQAGETNDIQYINKAAELLIDLSEREQEAMMKLRSIS